MRTAHLATTLALTLLLAVPSAGAQTLVAPPAAAPWQGAAPPAARPDDAAAQDAASARAVERLLATLDADARERRALGLGVGLGGGVAVMGASAWMLARDGAPRWTDNAGTYIGAAGVGLLLGGVLNAVLPAYLHELNDSWRETAGRPIAARRAHFGVVLDELAERTRAARVLAGRLSLGFGAAFVAVAVIAEAVIDDPLPGPNSIALVTGIGGAFIMASSVPALTMRSPVEHAAMFWRAGEARPTVRLAGVSVLPTRGGALAGVALVF
ncbi:MAG: hypothetical protein Q7V43_05290 [Myxococcales bacterium]|nr:hypothetical protein [Myxococcales bacterium]